MIDGQRILVFGASSAICSEVLKLFAPNEATFYLVARDENKLAAQIDDLKVRGGTVAGHEVYDFNQWEAHEAAVQRAVASLEKIDIVIIAHGTLPNQSECETSPASMRACMEDNFSSAAIIIGCCAAALATAGSGTLVAISSVAGDRGRKSNYAYGSAKAGIDALLQGLRARLTASGINVVNIKPGMIKTPMTQDMNSGVLWSTPELIAPKIIRAMSKGSGVYYVPGYWRYIMFIIRALPNAVMAKLPI
ncbi:MAG: decaprenylphospho-beta-D-erythro-pentofuranosid-2-ulose 2-reductase [Halioglobus sp.]|jgi:short-subunit dehydrogenase